MRFAHVHKASSQHHPAEVHKPQRRAWCPRTPEWSLGQKRPEKEGAERLPASLSHSLAFAEVEFAELVTSRTSRGTHHANIEFAPPKTSASMNKQPALHPSNVPAASKAGSQHGQRAWSLPAGHPMMTSWRRALVTRITCAGDSSIATSSCCVPICGLPSFLRIAALF